MVELLDRLHCVPWWIRARARVLAVAECAGSNECVYVASRVCYCMESDSGAVLPCLSVQCFVLASAVLTVGSRAIVVSSLCFIKHVVQEHFTKFPKRVLLTSVSN